MFGTRARLSILPACSPLDLYQSYFEGTLPSEVLCSSRPFAYRTVSGATALRAGVLTRYAIVASVTITFRTLACTVTSFAFSHLSYPFLTTAVCVSATVSTSVRPKQCCLRDSHLYCQHFSYSRDTHVVQSLGRFLVAVGR